MYMAAVTLQLLLWLLFSSSDVSADLFCIMLCGSCMAVQISSVVGSIFYTSFCFSPAADKLLLFKQPAAAVLVSVNAYNCYMHIRNWKFKLGSPALVIFVAAAVVLLQMKPCCYCFYVVMDWKRFSSAANVASVAGPLLQSRSYHFAISLEQAAAYKGAVKVGTSFKFSW
ncbi:hypothetical protein RHMOL_RhmolUnG0002200 [Rhododendron molle]|nr:hypothetical protein RHMOL_RhmolUnG0002200 [Rhododendron molle]